MDKHADEKHHRCPKCPASFNIPVSYVNRKKKTLTHTNLSSSRCLAYRCDGVIDIIHRSKLYSLVTLVILLQTNFTLHMATHNTSEPKCPICRQKFGRMASLKAHLMLHEKDEKLFCKECEKAFPTKVSKKKKSK